MVAVIVLVVLSTVVGMSVVENALRHRAVAQEVTTASVVVSLSVDRNVTDLGSSLAALSPQQLADLDSDVRILQQRGGILGLEVWDSTGVLLYADSGHAPGESVIPPDELRRALAGEAFVIRNDNGGRGVPLLEVFQPLNPDGLGGVDGVVEVLLAHSKVDAAVDSSVRQLRYGAGLLLLLFGYVLLMMRRRLRRRHYQAEHDPLTGLGNRTLLARRGATLPSFQAHRSSIPRPDSALLLIDLDGFKRVNDSLGHSVGDAVLVAVASRFRTVVRAEEEVVRLGGDEFAILLASLEADDAGDRLAERLLAVLREPVTIGPVSVEIDASIGVALRDSELDLGELLRRADVAMYQAKRRGGGYRRYTPGIDDNDADHLALLGDVRQAIADDQLFLNYQPKIDPCYQLTGVEALVRWMHPTRGLIAPGDFLPLVEATALMKPLTAWVLRHATAQAAIWRRHGLDVPVAVNVSPRTLLDDEFIPLVEETFTANGLPGSSLTIEITETAILEDPNRAREVIQQLRASGVAVSIDDFGTGFTSLAHLKHLPISEIKIDRGFIQGLLAGGADHSIVAYTIRLAHDLHIPVVAEGVESTAELDELRTLGCDQFQGFLIARPLDADGIEWWIQQHPQTPKGGSNTTPRPQRVDPTRFR
jgi:diguanylate cyclase (GGDEF)-like protein